ncbi:hypothetical protein ACLB2K_075407 [Fragaria x ananassa]
MTMFTAASPKCGKCVVSCDQHCQSFLLSLRKNCYTIPVTAGDRILVRASFYYGNFDGGYALFNVKRFALGAYQSTIRYPEDPYDRKWYSAYGLFTTNVRGEAEIPKIDVSGSEDYPPAAVLQNASTVNSTTSYIQLDTYLRDSPVPIYITTFFSEVVQLFTTSPNYKRSFQIYVDDEPYSEEIVPPFGGVVEVAITNITASNTSITLRSTSDANLPVLINAFEVYTVSELLSPGTDTRDLEGLAVLQLQFEVLIKWSGDPCLPSTESQWEWVECSTGKIPRTVSLNLSSFSLVGALPDFSSMDPLVTIDLHDNGLEGPIPKFLGSFPYLKQLDLSNNRFNGTIPTSLSKNKNLRLVVTGNCLTGMSCPPPPQVTPPAETPPAETPPDSPPDYQVPSAPNTTPLSSGSRPPPPDEFHIHSTSTATNNTAAQLLLLVMLLLETIIFLALF